MIASFDFGEDPRFFHFGDERFADDEVVDSPADVLFSRIEAI